MIKQTLLKLKRKIFTLLLGSAVLCHAAASPVAHKTIKKITKTQTPNTTNVILKKKSTNYAPIASIAQQLGWVIDPKLLCGGYYSVPAFAKHKPPALPIGDEQTDIHGKSTAFFLQTGKSVLTGNVVVKQPGRQITANQAVIDRDPKTGKITQINLAGAVHFQEANKLIISHQAHFDLLNNRVILSQVLYRIYKDIETGFVNAWGQASSASQIKPGVMVFKSASYSTCPPTSHTWQLRASSIHINQNTEKGHAWNTRLLVHHVPVFYFPYFSFPLNHARKSGFLYPTFGYSSGSGFNFSLPYYFNLAPNYDFTFTPKYINNRGFLLSGLFRYLTKKNSGFLSLSVIPHDRKFNYFQETAASDYPNLPIYQRQLQNDSTTRAYFAFQNNTIFNPHWSSAINLNYVTDDYYFQSFGGTAELIDTDQLYNGANIKYNGEHWHFLGLLQHYQTLHPINEAPILDQYSRLPELNLNGDFPNEKFGLDYGLNSQFVYFDIPKNFTTRADQPIGSRINFQPSISLPLIRSDGFVTPEVQFAATSYFLQDNQKNQIDRLMPIFDVDTGLYFDRDFDLDHHAYRQTLEPQIYYLYVPVENQNNIPIFDTTLPPFSVNDLYRYNRFVGIDRIGDANQISLGLSTDIIDNQTGVEKINASIGDILYLHRHQVCLTPDCIDDPTINDSVSPIVSQLNYYFTPKVSAEGDVAWDPNHSEVNNAGTYINYSPATNHILHFGYDFVRDGDVLDPSNLDDPVNNLNRIDFGAGWPLFYRVSAMANWNYNLSHSHTQTYFYGIQYSSCCYAVRFVFSRTLTAESLNGAATFNNSYYLQFQLKGLGSVGNSDPSTMLYNALPGYHDIFEGQI